MMYTIKHDIRIRYINSNKRVVLEIYLILEASRMFPFYKSKLFIADARLSA